jgi:SurA-like N-terminal domain
MSWKGSPVFGTKRGRRVAALAAAGLGACLVLAACSTPVKMGSAAIVGNERITAASLDTQVSNLQAAAKPYGSALQLTTAEMPTAVLSWLIRFDIMDQVAADHGISVSQAEIQSGMASINSQAASAASTDGYSGANEVLVGAGIPPSLFEAVGKYQAQETAYALKVGNGKLPSTTAQSNAFTAAFDKAQCQAAKSLNIQVSPQFGRMDYTQYAVVPAPNTLSQPPGTPSPASTEGLAPAC